MNNDKFTCYTSIKEIVERYICKLGTLPNDESGLQEIARAIIKSPSNIDFSILTEIRISEGKQTEVTKFEDMNTDAFQKYPVEDIAYLKELSDHKNNDILENLIMDVIRDFKENDLV